MVKEVEETYYESPKLKEVSDEQDKKWKKPKSLNKFTSIRSEYEVEAYGLKEEAEALMEGVSGFMRSKNLNMRWTNC